MKQYTITDEQRSELIRNLESRWPPTDWLRKLKPESETARLRAALLDTARRVEALKRECGMAPDSVQAIRNSEYMSIALAARAALLPDNAELNGGASRPT